MSRYELNDSGTGNYRIYDPSEASVGVLYFVGDAETERLKRWIQAHDEVLDILRNVGKISKRSELEAKAESLIARIEGKEEL